MAEGANYHGRFADAYWGADDSNTVVALVEIANVIEWSITLTCTTAESTVMAVDAFGKTREPGFKGAIATVTCHLSGDPADAAGAACGLVEGAKGALELIRTRTGTPWSDLGYSLGTKGSEGRGCICTGIEPGVDKDGIETITYTFQATKAVISTTTKP